MPSRSIRTIIVLGSLAIAGIIFIQGYWVSRTLDIQEEAFHQSATIALRQVAESISEYNKSELPKTELISRRSSNYYSVNVNSAIDANILEDYLFQELEKASLNTVFEYGVYDCSTDKLVYGNICNINEDSQEFVKSENLPKFDDLIYYFVVRFPSRGSYLVDSMRQSILFSLIAFLAIAFFAYAMWVILRQKQLTELQKDFINNMTHEFKTPISTIKISSEVFLKEDKIKADTRLHKYASIIKEQNERLNSQVEKVLQIAKLEKESFQLNKEQVNVHDILKDIIQNMEVKVNKAQGKIASALDATNPMIQADKFHLANIIQNLIDNAIKYCIEKPEIQIRTAEINGKLSLIIKDKGIGIKKEFQNKVFDKFFRVPTGNVHNVKGFGLGLFYIKNICDAHGWAIHLDSEFEKGTQISIQIAPN